MDKNNDMYGQDRKKEGMQNESADYRKNPMQNDAGSQSGVRKQDGCVRKARPSGTSAYGSQTTQPTPGAGGTGKRPGTADTDKTDAQKKQNTPGGSY